MAVGDLAPGDGGERLRTVAGVYRFWGRHAGLYAAQDYFTFLGRPAAVRGAAVAALALSEGQRVLEVGCGTGRNLRYLRCAVGSAGRIVAFDYSSDMLAAARALCRRRGWENVSFVQGDAAELNVDEQFDGVLSILAISAIPDWRSALRRCRDVLRPDGRIAICEASLFAGGPLALLNPAIAAVYRRGAAWNPGRDIGGELAALFGDVAVDAFAGGLYHVFAAHRSTA